MSGGSGAPRDRASRGADSADVGVFPADIEICVAAHEAAWKWPAGRGRLVAAVEAFEAVAVRANSPVLEGLILVSAARLAVRDSVASAAQLRLLGAAAGVYGTARAALGEAAPGQLDLMAEFDDGEGFR